MYAGRTGRRARRRRARGPAPAAAGPRSRRRTRRPSRSSRSTCCGGEDRGGQQAEPVAEGGHAEHQPEPAERPDPQDRRAARRARTGRRARPRPARCPTPVAVDRPRRRRRPARPSTRLLATVWRWRHLRVDACRGHRAASAARAPTVVRCWIMRRPILVRLDRRHPLIADGPSSDAIADRWRRGRTSTRAAFAFCPIRVTVQACDRAVAGPTAHRRARPRRVDAARRHRRARLDAATAALDPPFAVLDATPSTPTPPPWSRRAAGKPIRVASKSVRCRDAARATCWPGPGWRGVMAYTLPEAIWLVRSRRQRRHPGRLPDRGPGRAGRAGRRSDELAAAITLMVDSVDQLDLVDAVVAARPAGPTLRVCLDLDASWRPLGRRAHVGVRRSPLHSPAAGRRAGRRGSSRRPGFRLVGLMSYEAQIAGLGDAPPGRPLYGRRDPGRCSAGRYAELLRRRGAAVAAVREHADLEFVNGGGTGSVAATAADPSVTEVDRRLRAVRADPVRRLPGLAPDAGRVLRRCRWSAGPAPGMVTVHGGGWIASGPADRPGCRCRCCPAGLRLLGDRGRRRGADPAGRARPRTRCASATGSGSATPRPASCASTSTSCTWSRGDAVDRRAADLPRRARARRSSDARSTGSAVDRPERLTWRCR